MAKKEHISETQATQFLRKHGVGFTDHPYPYEEHGGTAVSARVLGVPEHTLWVRWQRVDSCRVPVVLGAIFNPGMSIVNPDLKGVADECCPYLDNGEGHKQRREWFAQ